MKFKIIINFARNNFIKNKNLVIPFIISTSIMNITFYIMTSLLSNNYVLNRHQIFPSIIQFGVIFIGIFNLIFIIYANRFLIKRRNKEFALYKIMGLESKHISLIIFFERLINYVITIILSIVGGQLFGKLSFIALNRLMNDKVAGMDDYPISIIAIILTIMIITLGYVIINLNNTISIYRNNVIELLSKQKKADGEPKSNIIIGIIGIITLAVGYYIAISIEGTLNSITNFFIAVLLVIVGTYLCFISLSIFILKKLKNNHRYYYRAHSFLSVSGMLYRMKANAVGLASISLLATSIIISLSTAMSIYSNIEKIVAEDKSKDVIIEYETNSNEIKSSDEILKIKNELYKNINAVSKNKIKDLIIKEHNFVPVIFEKNSFSAANNISAPKFLDLFYLDDYLAYTNDKSLSLNDDEIFLTSNSNKFKNLTTVKINNQVYKVKPLKFDIPKNVAVEAFTMIVKDREKFIEFTKYFEFIHYKTNKETINVGISASYNIENFNAKEYSSNFDKFIDKHQLDYIVDYDNHNKFVKNYYELNGGFIFLGILIGIILLSGTIIITYYKQISEAYEDRHSYQIMKQVGLPEELIKKTTKNQVIWIFFTPLVISLIHSLVASKIVSQLLFLFGINDWLYYFQQLILIVGCFAIAYIIIYFLTSKIYYQIVNE